MHNNKSSTLIRTESDCVISSDIYASHACKGSIRWRGTLAIMKGKKLLCMNKKKGITGGKGEFLKVSRGESHNRSI